MKISKLGLLILLLTLLGMLPGAMAQTAENVGLPYPTAATPKAIDLGELKEQFGTTPISVTIALRLPNINEAEDLLKSINTPGDPQFHQFLTAEQFLPRFAPTDADVAAVISEVAKYGLTAERISATTLKVTGLPADMERAFAVSLHSYEVPAHENVTGYTFHAPLSHPTIPAEISASTAAVVGLDSRPNFRPLYRTVPQTLPVPPPVESVPPTATGNAFGYLTVTDFANLYDVQPLYSHGMSGSGRTIGIMTLASFKPSDAFAYWKALGLSVNENRIRAVNIDGGPGAPSDASGSIETTIDVEQSGGIAPGANIVVYQAPNTNQGFVDIFARAVDANLAESLSISWGQWEWFDNFENSPVTDPTTGKTVGVTVAVHELLVRAAIQGQTVFAASGDGGAYDAFNDLVCTGPYSPSQPYSCSLTLSVDYPASDPAITAGGGTTLAGTQKLCLNAACTPPYLDIKIPQQRVWGWDWLEPLCKALGTPNPITCGIFPAGSGGGVSVIFEEPSYQTGLHGIQRSQPHQVFQAGKGFAADDIGLFYALPSNYPGRNVPDISFNADPYTGYVVYYTSEPSGVFSAQNGWGGTSFVGPQLNGVSALLGEYLQGGGLGLLNNTLYALALKGQAYGRQGAPLHAIAYGDNWFYDGSNGYNPAAGLGTLDVWNFAEVLRRLQY
jgi:subtilase family serine protease